MGTSYVRQSSFSDGDTITAALFNDEFNRLLTAFSYASSSTTGHQHDGTAGEGGNVHTIGDQDFLNKIVADSTNNRWGFFVEVSSSAVEQIRIQDGAIVPVTDNDIDLGTSSLEFKDAYFDGTVTTDALVADTADINGGTVDGATIGASSATTIVGTTITANTSVVPDASDGATLGSASLEWSDLYMADGAVIYFGDDQDVSLTHVVDTGILLSSTDQLQFGDSGTYIYQSADGVLDLVSDTEIELTATTIDINGAVAMDGAITGGTNITISGELDAATLDISGNADIDGTLEADAITVDGTALNEYIADTVGAMVSSNTETNITVTYEDGDNTLDFVIGTLNQDTSGTAALATSVTASANNTTDETVYLTFVDGATGTQGIETDTGLTYNPSTGLISATGFSATNLTGTLQSAAQTNVTSIGTLTALTVDDVAVDGKVITMTGSASDTAVFTAGTNGTLDITTTDAAAAAANIQITADGTAELAGTTVTLDSGGGITLDADSGTITFADGGSSLGTITSSGYSGTAAVATAVTITDNENTNENNAIIFTAGGDVDGGNIGLESDGDLTYNPSTGLLSSTGLTASGTVTYGTLSDGTIGVTAWVDEDDMSSDSATLVPTQQSVKAYVDSNAADMSFVMEDDDGTEVTITGNKEVKIIGSGITTNWTDTDNGTDGDPYDLTLTVDAAQTGITSIYATDLIMGEDSQTAIDFGTANEIDFKVDNAARLTLTASALYPVTDNQIDLGTSSLEFKDAFFDGTVTADAFAGPLTGDVTGNVSGTAATVTTAAQSNITSLGTLTTLTVDNVIINGTTIGHTSDTDLMTVADGVLTIAGELDATTLDISGNADIDGTTNLDAVDIDGAVQIDGATNFGVNDTGVDVKFFGATAGKYMLWDESQDSLIINGGVQEAATTVTSSSNATTINLDSGTNFLHDLTENTTFTFSNPPAAAGIFTLKIIQDSSTRAITWPGTVDWPSATPPTLTSTNNAVDVFVFLTIDGGTIWYGFTAGQAMA